MGLELKKLAEQERKTILVNAHSPTEDMLHKIENMKVGTNEILSESERTEIEETLEEIPQFFDYHTDAYERRAYRTVRQLKPLKLKSFVPGL